MVSIIVITFNRCNLLLKTLNSILKQTYVDFELILIDDGSTDNTKDAVNSISDNRIKYFNFGKIGNLSKLRNIGIKNSNFEYVAFCDDDDLWVENKLEEQMKHCTDFKLICTNAVVIDENDKVIKEKYYESFIHNFVITKDHLLRTGNSVLTSSLLIHKEILYDKDLFFDEVIVTNYCEDYELFLRISKYNDFLFLDNNFIKKRQHSSVSGGLDNNLIMLNSSVNILKNYTGKRNRLSNDFAVEGILGYKILRVRLSFKKDIKSGLSELFNFLIYMLNPFVFYIFLKTKVFRKLNKLFNF